MARAGDGGLATAVRPLLAELVGTFVLTFVSAAGLMLTRSTGKPGDVAVAVAAGLAVAVMTYTVGAVSGAHINPAVTFAFSLRGVGLPRRSVPRRRARRRRLVCHPRTAEA